MLEQPVQALISSATTFAPKPQEEISRMVDEGVGVAVRVGVGVDKEINVGVRVRVGVGVDKGTDDRVGVRVRVGVDKEIEVGVSVRVRVGVDKVIDVGVRVRVGVNVGVKIPGLRNQRVAVVSDLKNSINISATACLPALVGCVQSVGSILVRGQDLPSDRVFVPSIHKYGPHER